MASVLFFMWIVNLQHVAASETTQSVRAFLAEACHDWFLLSFLEDLYGGGACQQF